jgi:isopenicillin-N N-acyltransferase-like protein
MLEVLASGSPSQIGFQHGSAAKQHIGRSIKFYQNLFQTQCKMDWETVKSFAIKYQSYLESNFATYITEMQGVAEGAGVTYEDILALNVRTEIAFGAFNDGCTALSWKSGERSILAQNWDWNTEFVVPFLYEPREQGANLPKASREPHLFESQAGETAQHSDDHRSWDHW